MGSAGDRAVRQNSPAAVPQGCFDGDGNGNVAKKSLTRRSLWSFIESNRMVMLQEDRIKRK
ncbi:hypothetical protein HMPREF1985_01672 [Mitsuokella sp. oral taxon 131 str. W9106]|nr:hypothetical protein HMPREF1985_01672 [Mitsuokella sp. oral taxon 131 str. W9106]